MNKSFQLSFDDHDELIKTIDKIMAERPELFEKLSKL